MRVTIVTPALRGARHGNRVTALRWAAFLRRQGHRVRVRSQAADGDTELLIALHAEKSAGAVRAFRARRPRAPVVVAIAGTDLYGPGGLSPAALEALALAARVVVLQPRALELLPAGLRARTRVIVQSARVERVAAGGEHGGELRAVCLAHLRPVKDPLLAAEAARRLPPDSRVRIVQIGAALDPGLAARAVEESRANPRWSWIGPLPRRAALARLASAQLFVSSSRSEGGANALSEALAAGVPPLVTDAAGNLGVLGNDYPGVYPVGDAGALAALLERYEGEPAFRAELGARTRALADLVRPEVECAAWARLLAELEAEQLHA